MVTTGRAHCIHNCILCSLFIQVDGKWEFKHILEKKKKNQKAVIFWGFFITHFRKKNQKAVIFWGFFITHFRKKKPKSRYFLGIFYNTF